MSINNDISARAEHLAFTSSAIATMGACPVWDAAMGRYLAALTLCEAEMQYGAHGKAEDADDLERLLLKNQHGKTWDELPEAITAPFEQARSAAERAWTENFAQPQWDAATALVGTPAPTLAAAVFKHTLIQREETPQWTDLPFDCMDVLAADFACLINLPRATDAWATAWATFEKVRAESEAYDRDHWQPAYDAAQAGGPDIPAPVEAEMQRLIDARDEADDAIISTPAPDLAAAIWKLEYTRERRADCDGQLPNDWWQAIVSDLRRLRGNLGASYHQKGA